MLAERLKRPIEEIEQMPSERFEEWLEFFETKFEFEEAARKEAEREAKLKSLPKGTMHWEYDLD